MWQTLSGIIGLNNRKSGILLLSCDLCLYSVFIVLLGISVFILCGLIILFIPTFEGMRIYRGYCRIMIVHSTGDQLPTSFHQHLQNLIFVIGVAILSLGLLRGREIFLDDIYVVSHIQLYFRISSHCFPEVQDRLNNQTIKENVPTCVLRAVYFY